jgi:hypothetical protein
MRRTPNNFDGGRDDGNNGFDGDEFDDDRSQIFFDDDLGLITPEMAEDLARYMADEWREREEGKSIKLDLTLAAALSKTPAKWLDAACIAHRISKKGQRKTKVTALTHKMTDTPTLVELVRNTPAHARAALRKVIEGGGWMKLNALIKDFGDMEGDGWFWDEIPPTSSLGELRQRALLFVGRAVLGKTGKKAYKVAVVPRDLRAALLQILSDPNVKAEEEEAIVSRFASPDEVLREALEEVRTHFSHIEWDTAVGENDVEAFLLEVHSQGYDALNVWQSLEVVLDFLDHQSHEIVSLDDIGSYHISELVHEFVDRHYLPRWSLNLRRDLLETVQRFYKHLHKTGRANDDALIEVDQACAQIRKGKRKLNVIKRPPPLGGELILARANPNTGREERYTFNHQRILMVWASECHQDWRHMLQVCKTVPDGHRKAELVHDLIALEPSTQELLIARSDEDDFANGVIWFYKENVLELSSW